MGGISAWPPFVAGGRLLEAEGKRDLGYLFGQARSWGIQPWLACPKDKDILKLDMATMKIANQVKRVGNSGKWTLADSKEERV